ncbi:type 1 glutamine amidotransferase domain-containing protein [Halocatena halophila]|uniref:type 1 glutamine amidotransferase domain-containing protein n=1 Tax=Halocatena halophila TaxID=2814576 RepID=UPI002ED494D0
MTTNDSQRVLFVVTNHDQLGATDEKTGYWLSEASHPYHVLTDAGFAVDFASPEGGVAPVDPESEDLDDPINEAFVESDAYTDQLQNTHPLDDIDPTAYEGIVLVGGHGPMWDFPDNEQLQSLLAQIYESGGVVGAACHGSVGLVNVQLSNGDYLVDGKRLTSFTDEEEQEVALTDAVPFLLETKLEERGADHHASDPWAEYVEVDGRLVTGQNPASAKAVGEALVRKLESSSA